MIPFDCCIRLESIGVGSTSVHFPLADYVVDLLYLPFWNGIEETIDGRVWGNTSRIWVGLSAFGEEGSRVVRSNY